MANEVSLSSAPPSSSTLADLVAAVSSLTAKMERQEASQSSLLQQLLDLQQQQSTSGGNPSSAPPLDSQGMVNWNLFVLFISCGFHQTYVCGVFGGYCLCTYRYACVVLVKVYRAELSPFQLHLQC